MKWISLTTNRQTFFKKKCLGAPVVTHRVKNQTGSIPGLARWIKDLALPQAWVADSAQIPFYRGCGIGCSSVSTPTPELPHATGVAIKQNQTKTLEWKNSKTQDYLWNGKTIMTKTAQWLSWWKKDGRDKRKFFMGMKMFRILTDGGYHKFSQVVPRK